jgi:GT2 family glycosyltransferase
MMRLLIAMVKTPYILWLDDDSHFIDPHWPEAIGRFIEREHPFDVAGQSARWGPRRDLDPLYMKFIRARPWWRTDMHQPPDLREWVPFVVGGMFLARTAFLREHDFPDSGMVKAMDDVALGELIHQVGGRMVGLPGDILNMMRISDGHRRGEKFSL